MDRILLEESCEILDSRRIPITASNRKEGPYPYYGANGIQDYVDDYIFDDELVLLAEDGGNFGSKERPIAYRVSGKCWVNNHAHVLKPKDGINVDYLCYSLMFYDTGKLVNGATRQKLTQAMMRKMLIPKRSISEQKKIVATLNTIRDSITKQTKRIKLLDNLIKARFVEMFNGNYEEVGLSELGKISTGSTPSMKNKDFYENTDTPFYKPGDFIDGVSNIDCSESFIDARAESISKIMNPGTVAVTCIGIIGKIGIIKRRGICNQQINFITPNDNVNSTYLAYAIDTKKRFMQEKANAPVVPILNKTNFSKVTIPFAPVKLQNQFATFVAQVDKSKFALSNELAMGNFYIRLIHDCIMHGSIDL